MTDGGAAPLQAADQVLALAGELRRVRVATGMSLKELEHVTASSDSSLSRYLAGASVPPWAVVDALCRAAQRNPEDLVDLWQAAQCARVERRSLVKIDNLEAGESASSEQGRIESATRKRPRAKRTRRLVPAVGACCAVIAATIVITVQLSTSPRDRVCPWHYVVTDGNPANVLIANSPDADRKHIGYYVPYQVFYAPEPPITRNGMLKTVGGWVTLGNWIQRYPAPCVDSSSISSRSRFS